ncbi:MAG TPA: enoyl-CoA hydratase, partial [Porticoccaceae bacterium]|nr:enoyl-CoA hydratase [Porticoccaceae bacterium]
MTYKTIDYTTENSILTLTLSRPEQLNSFTIEMSHELIDAFNRASDDDEVGAIVVTGAGRAFC